MKLYLLINKLGDWYIVAESPNKAKEMIENALDEDDYGFSDYRKITNIKLLAEEIKPALNSKFFFSGGDNLMIQSQLSQNES